MRLRLRTPFLYLTAQVAFLPAAAASDEDTDPSSYTGEYSAYESEAIQDAVRTLGSPIDPSPEGKIIERIEIITLDPVETRDPTPSWLNALHSTTRHGVVERDLLVHVGDKYQKVVVDESARNLRSHPQLSVVLSVALRGTTDDRVWLVVITKDVWSLMPDFDLQIESGGYDYILLEPEEMNLLGTHEIVLGRLNLTPKAYSMGGAFKEPRLNGTWISLLADANVVMNKTSGAPEGSFGTLEVIKPLASSKDPWSWFMDAAWRSEVTRRYSNGDVYAVALDGTTVADEHHTQRALLEGALTRSFGWKQKNDVTFGFTMSRDQYRVDPTVQAAISRGLLPHVPTSDTRVGPALELHLYTSDFLRTLDYDTLGLQEDYRLGYDVVLRAYPILRAFGSTRNVLGFYAAVQYTLPLATGLIRGAVESRTEWDVGPHAAEASCVSACGISDGSVAAHLTIVSPLTAAGRLLFGGQVLNRYRNYLNATSFLGSNSRLRGYPASSLSGDNEVSGSVELRTRPIEAWSMQWALAGFYDVGEAFDRFSEMGAEGGLRSDLGAGIRMVWPELERAVFRLDFGFPLNRTPLPGKEQRVDPWTFSFSFGQAFGTDAIAGTSPPEGNEVFE
jgi:hypothetical protein